MTIAKKLVQTLITAAALSPLWAYSQTVIKFAHYGPTSDPVHVGALKFKEVLEKESGGAFKVEIFPQEQLGKGADMISSALCLAHSLTWPSSTLASATRSPCPTVAINSSSICSRYSAWACQTPLTCFTGLPGPQFTRQFKSLAS